MIFQVFSVRLWQSLKAGRPFNVSIMLRIPNAFRFRWRDYLPSRSSISGIAGRESASSPNRDPITVVRSAV